MPVLGHPRSKFRCMSGTGDSRWLAKDTRSQTGNKCRRLDIGTSYCSSNCPAGRCRNDFERVSKVGLIPPRQEDIQATASACGGTSRRAVVREADTPWPIRAPIETRINAYTISSLICTVVVWTAAEIVATVHLPVSSVSILVHATLSTGSGGRCRCSHTNRAGSIRNCPCICGLIRLQC